MDTGHLEQHEKWWLTYTNEPRPVPNGTNPIKIVREFRPLHSFLRINVPPSIVLLLIGLLFIAIWNIALYVCDKDTVFVPISKTKDSFFCFKKYSKELKSGNGQMNWIIQRQKATCYLPSLKRVWKSGLWKVLLRLLLAATFGLNKLMPFRCKTCGKSRCYSTSI